VWQREILSDMNNFFYYYFSNAIRVIKFYLYFKLTIMKIKLFTLLLCVSGITFANTAKYVAKYTSEKMTIDGSATEAIWTEAIKDSISVLIYSNTGSLPARSDYFAYFKMVYNESNLYCVVFVQDNAMKSCLDVGKEVWNSDCIEMFFNPLKIAEINQFPMYYSSECHFPIGVKPGDIKSTNPKGLPLGIFAGSGYANTIGDYSNYIYKTVTTSTGYIIEMQLPWALLFNTTANNAPIIKAGTTMPFDINGCDADVAANARIHTIGWATTSGEDYRNNSQYGTLELGAYLSAIALPSNENVSFNLNREKLLMVNGLTENSRGTLTIYNFEGKEIKCNNLRGSFLQVDMSSLPSGIYLVRLINNCQAVTQKILLK